MRATWRGVQREGPSSRTEGMKEKETHQQKALSPEQRIVEADKRRQRRLAALSSDHIMKLREKRQKLAQEWVEEYAILASSVKLPQIELGT